MAFKNKVRGFTLIELMVVIAIIGILASLIVLATGTSRDRARDSRRMSDFREIPAAQEFKMGDDGVYTESPRIVGSIPAVVNNAGKTYMKELVDPLNNGSYKYIWVGNDADCGGKTAGKYFCAVAKMEEKNKCPVGQIRYFIVTDRGGKEICRALDFILAGPTCLECLAF